MAQQTSKTLRNQVIYSVFVRCHTPEGTFEGVRRDLPRIRALGADIIWLMPIHPIGEVQRKGTLGSPYAIRDYRAVNPEYGTEDDFRLLVREIHRLGMRCIIDVVYNHTSGSTRSGSTAARTGASATGWGTGPTSSTWTTASLGCGTTRSRP